MTGTGSYRPDAHGWSFEYDLSSWTIIPTIRIDWFWDVFSIEFSFLCFSVYHDFKLKKKK